MRQYVLAIATASIVALGVLGADRVEAAPIGAAGALHTATDGLNQTEPVQYAGGRCWRNGWHGPGWYPCWHPGVAFGGGTWGGGHWGWHDHYSWRWHDGGRRGWHGDRGGNRHAGHRRGGGRHAHASGHHGGRHGGGHRGGHHGGGHHGGGHHGGGHRR